MKKAVCLLTALLCLSVPMRVAAIPEEGGLAAAMAVTTAPDTVSNAAILIEQESGQVLYEKDADAQIPPASITKVMVLLLTMEALEDEKIHLTDMVTVSEEAAGMGGSQIWLEPGEQMSVDDLIKATAVKSANDAAAALGEYVGGSISAFVEMMNERASELGMTGTHFENPTGLDAPGHLSTARDVAIMSRFLLQYEMIRHYSTIWIDTLRNGTTQLVNTNKLVRFYDGCTGLKTGTTDSAGYCLSASATRNGLSLIAVVMGAPTSQERFDDARHLLDYGFANYQMYTPQTDPFPPLKVSHGVTDTVDLTLCGVNSFLIPKGKEDELLTEISLADAVEAPVNEGQVVGKIVISLEEEPIAEVDIVTTAAVKRMNFWNAFLRIGYEITAGSWKLS